jgi:predicted O-methyltransferase YrrM
MTITIPIATQIEASIQTIPGFSRLDQLLALFTLAYTSADLKGDILELGSWCGRSAVALGMAARLTGNSKVHCVDLFPGKKDWEKNADGTYSFEVNINGKIFGAYGEQTVWAEPFERDIAPVYEKFSCALDAFNNSITNNALSDWVIPFKGDLSSFAENAPNGFKLRMAFIDGDHSYAAVAKDIGVIERFLEHGGWICFDDAFSGYQGVDRAIKEKIIDSPHYDLKQQLTRKMFVAKRCSVAGA